MPGGTIFVINHRCELSLIRINPKHIGIHGIIAKAAITPN